MKRQHDITISFSYLSSLAYNIYNPRMLLLKILFGQFIHKVIIIASSKRIEYFPPLFVLLSLFLRKKITSIERNNC